MRYCSQVIQLGIFAKLTGSIWVTRYDLPSNMKLIGWIGALNLKSTLSGLY